MRPPCASVNYPMAKDRHERVIIHVDMDCFYAAIEMRERPELRGKPMAVGGTRGRGVLTTCNYEARKFGCRSAMPTFMALQRCPQLIVVSPRFDLYRREAKTVREVFYRFTKIVEPLSLDEAYLDVSEHDGAPGALAHVIREMIRQRTQLTCSAGVAPNKLLAKIASEINKPDGQCEIAPPDIADFMRELPVRKLWGIGEKTEKKLDEIGIKTCGEMQRFSRAELVDLFGKFGLELYDQCRGIDERAVEPDRPRKSFSSEETFDVDLTTLLECEAKVCELVPELIFDLAQKEPDREITKIFVKLKFADFTRTTIERTGFAVSLDAFQLLLAEAFARTGKPVRLIGVGVRFAEPSPNESQLSLL